MSGLMARALWYESADVVALRATRLPEPTAGFACIRSLFSGISRGTERLVFGGRVPRDQWTRMRAPLQEGDFPFPVKYGYCAVGVVEAGPAELLGRAVFCLHPHQDRFIAPAKMLALVPDDVPARRATLAANMETALNALWDSGAGPADRIVVIGGGIAGLLIGFLAARLPGAQVTLCDIDPSRAEMVEHLGMTFAHPDALPRDADVVFHTSASESGLAAAIGCAGVEACIVEMSWYGDKIISVRLGSTFHSQRLRIVSSQVGMVSPSRRVRWPHQRRLDAALKLLRDGRLDALVGETIDFADAPRELPRVLAEGALGLAPVIRYPEPDGIHFQAGDDVCHRGS
jgi:NADPH:quinone reductase-like Zn-dependent oxidoreductase